MSKVLVMGGSGLVGKAIIKKMIKYKEFQIYTTFFESPIPLSQDRSFKLNIENVDNIDEILNALNPRIIISCLRGDFNKQLVLHKKIAEYLEKNGGRLYFLSTANVFDGDLSKPHYEDDLPNSCTDYGRYKIKCEKKIVEILNDDVCILRLPQVWGKDSPRMKHILTLLKNNEKIVVYPNLLYNTISDAMVAEKIAYIIKHNLKGNFHLTTNDVISHKKFYIKLIIGLGFNNAIIEENFEEEGCFALLTNRNNEFSESLGLENKSVINYLVN